jgi:hypothetical protein
MRRFFSFALCLALPLFATTFVAAKTLEIPEKKPLFSVVVPDSWTVEELEKGLAVESKDGVVTVFFEVTGAKGLDQLLDETIDWLKDQKVKIDESTKKESDFKVEGMDWSRISWKGSNEEWGKSDIAFMFGDLGHGKIAVITYWLPESGLEKHIPSINKMFDSFKRITPDE